ncbi:MAG TPA: hypothetical protein VFB82_00695, partial [Blastocatellia bacterium]|nr:hypothetical protein [Blastocatellia bacterium]
IVSVHKILDELNLSGIPRVLVFNKSDLLTTDELANMNRGSDPILISALDRKSLLPLTSRVAEMLEANTKQPTTSPERDAESAIHSIR